MERTITITIASKLFTISEEAYLILRDYLEDIERRLNDPATYFEIEIRIAEILESLTPRSYGVINRQCVEDVMAQIGSPQIFGNNTLNNNIMRKRLMRDPRNKVIFGVCSGLSAYIGLETTIVKIVFVLLAIFGGSGVLVYLIMAILMPKAVTDNDFEMLDKSINGEI